MDSVSLAPPGKSSSKVDKYYKDSKDLPPCGKMTRISVRYFSILYIKIYLQDGDYNNYFIFFFELTYLKYSHVVSAQ